jgi:serine/threonine protein phosphatase PrpC
MSSFNISLPSFYIQGDTSSNGLSYSEDGIERIILQNGIIFLIVIDGHGGNECLKLIQSNIYNMIDILFTSIDITNIQEIYDQIKNLYCELDKLTHNIQSGACISIITKLPNNYLFLSYLGDCRTYIFNNTQLVYISKDHDPSDEYEGKQVKLRGGRVTFFNGPRLSGKLGISRALGDCEIKGVGKEPEIRLFSPDMWTHFLVNSDCLTDAIRQKYISNEPSYDENGIPCVSPLHILQQEAEPNVTEELSILITNYMVNSCSINEALENIIKILIEIAKTYPDNYSIILGSLL